MIIFCKCHVMEAKNPQIDVDFHAYPRISTPTTAKKKFFFILLWFITFFALHFYYYCKSADKLVNIMWHRVVRASQNGIKGVQCERKQILRWNEHLISSQTKRIAHTISFHLKCHKLNIFLLHDIQYFIFVNFSPLSLHSTCYIS